MAGSDWRMRLIRPVTTWSIDEIPADESVVGGGPATRGHPEVSVSRERERRASIPCEKVVDSPFYLLESTMAGAGKFCPSGLGFDDIHDCSDLAACDLLPNRIHVRRACHFLKGMQLSILDALSP